MFHTEAHLVAQIVDSSCATTHQAIVLFVKFVVVARQITQRHHAFALRESVFHVNTKLGHSRDNAIKLLSDAVCHKFCLFVFDARALSSGSHQFALGAVLTEFFIFFRTDRASPLSIFCEKAMHHQVGIATNGRSEVGVVAEHQTIVTNVVHRIARSHHRTQCHHLHHMFFLLAFHFREQIVQTFRNVRLRTLGAHLVTEFCHKSTEFLHFFGIGHIVDTIRQHLGLLSLRHDSHLLSHSAVGEEHKFLHEFVGILGYLHISGDGMSFFVNFKAHFGAVKSDRTSLETLGA